MSSRPAISDGLVAPDRDDGQLDRKRDTVETTTNLEDRGGVAGVMQMCRVLGRELGRYGIRANTVSCGLAQPRSSENNPVDRVGDAGARVLSKLDKRRMFPVAGLIWRGRWPSCSPTPATTSPARPGA